MPDFILRKHSDKFIIKKWRQFANVAVNNNDRLDQRFYLWKKGTDIVTVLCWFDRHYSKGVMALYDKA